MCNTCGQENGTTRHLLYWQWRWLIKREWKKFFKTWYHIFNRKVYWEWKINQEAEKQVARKLGMILSTRGEYARMSIDYEYGGDIGDWVRN